MQISKNYHDVILNDCLNELVEKVNQTNLTIYSYTGDKKHEPIYYEETELFKQMLTETGVCCHWQEISDELFKPQNWKTQNAILHIPGAISTELDFHLGKKIEAIKTFVCQGGSFLGWCGGAYWACRTVSYQNQSIALYKTRDLALWKGEEVGPLLPYLGNPEGNIGFFHGAVSVKWKGSEHVKKYFPDGFELSVLLSGGGSFLPAKDEYPYKVLATYQDKNIKNDCRLAGVKTFVGNGKAVLMNPYFTHGADYLRKGLEGYEKHFPDHQWAQIVDRLEGNKLKSMICFVDMLLEMVSI